MIKLNHRQIASGCTQYEITCPACGAETSFIVSEPNECSGCLSPLPSTHNILEESEHRIDYFNAKEDFINCFQGWL